MSRVLVSSPMGDANSSRVAPVELPQELVECAIPGENHAAVEIQTGVLKDFAQEAIARQVRRLQKHHKAFLKTHGVEAIHQMRVCLRRLRMLMELLNPMLELPPDFKVKRLRKLGQELGTVRDYDILLENLQAFFFPTSSTASSIQLSRSQQSILLSLEKQLKQHRKTALKNAIAAVESSAYQRTEKLLEQWLQSPQCSDLGSLPSSEFVPELLLPAWSFLWCHSGWVANLPLAESWQQQQPIFTNLHDLRKVIKGVRYQLESCAEFYATTIDDEIQRLKTLQDTLGRLQDLAVFQQFLLTACQTQPQLNPSLLLQPIAQDLSTTWAAWLELRAYFYTLDYRTYIREEITHPVGLG
ncbi:MAG: CHAD domain-containing protein [Synechococcales bacterium]|nr:CHAD domain-containing protein [Synechococcales bacterium]